MYVDLLIQRAALFFLFFFKYPRELTAHNRSKYRNKCGRSAKQPAPRNPSIKHQPFYKWYFCSTSILIDNSPLEELL